MANRHPFTPAAPVIGFVLVIVCAVAAAAGSYLSATKVITVRAEKAAYFYLFLGVAVGALLCWVGQPRGPTGFGRGVLRLLVGAVAVVGLVTVFEAWRRSNHTFMFWTVRTVSTASWDEMAKELRTLGAESLREVKDDYVMIRKVPGVVDQVGRRSELRSARVQRFSTEPDDFVVQVEYGYKSRRWGLCSGAAKHCTGGVPKRPTQQVAEGLFFVMWTE